MRSRSGMFGRSGSSTGAVPSRTADRRDQRQPGARTPGTAAAAASGPLEQREPRFGRDDAARRVRRRRPGSRPCRDRCRASPACRSVRMNSPAATTSTSVSATWTTSSGAPNVRRAFAGERPSLLLQRVVSDRPPRTRSAGATPNSSAVATATSAVKPTTRQSSDRSSATVPRGVDSCPHDQPAAPLREQQSERGADRRRAAGSRPAAAGRCGIARRRAPDAASARAGGRVARASSRLAMLAQAISSTSTTTAMMIQQRPLVAGAKARPGPPAAETRVRPSRRYSSELLRRPVLSGSVASRICGCDRPQRRVACSAVWPGFSRAMISSTQVERASSQLCGPAHDRLGAERHRDVERAAGARPEERRRRHADDGERRRD